MQTFQAQLAYQLEAELGEGPLWHPVHQQLYFVDITQGTVYAFDPDRHQTQHWKFPNFTAALAQGANDTLFVAEQHQLSLLDTQSGTRTKVLNLDLPSDVRFNECKCDPQGRFWMGTMQLEAKERKGNFYRVDLDHKVEKILPELTIPNGFCWTEDQQFLYHIDSFQHRVIRYRYHAEAGTLSDPTTVFTNPHPQVFLDGMCMDQKGHLWIACWGGHQVICVDPVQGTIIATVQVPAPHVTSCIFGGDDFTDLYITTARLGLTDKQLEQYPLSGSLFVGKVASSGRAANACRINS
ncbi:MAG: SMP-30/gluconolactonase/LRE family protein [Bacteroidota bacterium]